MLLYAKGSFYRCFFVFVDYSNLKMRKNLTPEETLDWIVRVASADGLISPNEKNLIREFASSCNLDAEDIIEIASQKMVLEKPEVEIIDYKVKNGLQFEQLMVSFLKDNSTFKLLEWTGDKYVDGIYDLNNLNPDLHIRQVINNVSIDYYIECKWHHFWQRGEKGYYYEMRESQLQRYRRFQREKKRVVLVAYAFGRTGSNPRGIYLIPLHAFRDNKISKTVADKKYRIEQTSEAFTLYMEHFFNQLFSRKST